MQDPSPHKESERLVLGLGPSKIRISDFGHTRLWIYEATQSVASQTALYVGQDHQHLNSVYSYLWFAQE